MLNAKKKKKRLSKEKKQKKTQKQRRATSWEICNRKKNSQPSTQTTITKMRRSCKPKLLFDDQIRMKELLMVASCTQALHGRMCHK